MKKEVFRLIKDSQGKSRQGIVSILLTILVIGVLLISGPAQAVTLGITDLSTSTPDEGSDVSFTISVDIADGERIPVQYLTLTIGSDSCQFAIDGTEQAGDLCDSVSITQTVESQPYSEYDYSANMYGYDTGNDINYTFGPGYGYGYDAVIPQELEYDVVWTTSSVSENTAYTVQLDAYADNGVVSHTYSEIETDFITVQDVAVTIVSANVAEPDNFYSFVAGNDVVNLIVEANGAASVIANFSNLGDIDCGLGSDTIALASNGTHWLGSCDVGDEAALANFAGGAATVVALDGVGGYDTEIVTMLLYSMTTFTDAPCTHFGEDSTDFSEELDFSDINFVVDMELDIECLLDTYEDEELPVGSPDWMYSLERVLLLNFSSVDMSNESVAQMIGDFSKYLDFDLVYPGEFGDSRIFINSSYLDDLDTAASITIYHLPFTSEPEIDPDIGADVPAEVIWTQGSGEGTLYFSVGGFSGYDIIDEVNPIVTIGTPAESSTLVSPVLIEVTINTTGTDLSSAIINASGAVYTYVYGGTNTANCTSALNDGYYECTVTAPIASGAKAIVVAATDFGGEEGNTGTDTVNIVVDNDGPETTITAVTAEAEDYTSDTWVNTADVTVGAACDDEYSTCVGLFYCVDTIGECDPTTPYTTEIVVSDENITYFRYYSIDDLGNEENVTDFIVKLDRTEPVIDVTSPANLSSSTTYVTVRFSANDTYSLDNCWWTLDSYTTKHVVNCASSISSEWTTGTHTVYVWAQDGAGSNATDAVTFTKLASTSGGGTGGGWISAPNGWTFTLIVSNEQMIGGWRRALGKMHRFRFRVNNLEHSLGVINIDGRRVTIQVSSEPQTAILEPGESTRFDVDLDGWYDVYATLHGVEDGKADLTVQSIREEVGAEPPEQETAPPEPAVEPVQPSPATCTPDWRCGEWSECTGGERARVCVDNNGCGTSSGKPAESESCTSAFKIPWATILAAAMIIAVLSFAIIFYLQKRYEDDD